MKYFIRLLSRQDRHWLKFAFVLIYFQNIPCFLTYLDTADDLFLLWSLDFSLDILKHLNVNLIPFSFSFDHFHWVTATEKPGNDSSWFGFFISQISECLCIFDMEQFASLHLRLSQCASLIEAQSFHSSTLDCLFSLGTQNTVSMKSNKTERIEHIEIDRKRCRKCITDIIEVPEDCHWGLNVNTEEKT